MRKLQVLHGVWWVDIPEEDLSILCGAPMDITKHLMKLGIIREIEKNGVNYHTGPNAILLSDIQVQNGYFWNLAEFPLLHMMYRQGMALTDHPGFKAKKPMLIGLSEITSGISSYVRRGFYGLFSMDEMRKCGVPDSDIENLWHLKQCFAGGKIRSIEELMDIVPLNQKGGRITKNLLIERLSVNRYRFLTSNDTLEIDMSFPEQKKWYPSYDLKHSAINPMGFSVVHIGEGNGWDPERPCVGSLITYKGRKYLIDAGPNILFSIEHLGMSINEIDAVLFTHTHDDHFSGFSEFLNRDKPIIIYAVDPVIGTLRFKFQSLVSNDEDILNQMTDIRSIPLDTWTNINGLEIMPKWSAHPVETTIFYVRSKEGNNYKNYGHIVDIVSRKVMNMHIRNGELNESFAKKIIANYLWECDVKKVDVSRGLIHGHAEDFSDDTSNIIVLAHTENQASEEDKKYGVEVDFGDVEVLIPAQVSYEEYFLSNELEQSFPFLGAKELDRMKACQFETLESGVNLSEFENLSENLFLILSGSVQRCPEKILVSLKFTSGGLIGEEEYLFNNENIPRYLSLTSTRCLKIPSDLYNELLNSAGYFKKRQYYLEIRRFLYSWSFPGQKTACPQLDRLTEKIEDKYFRKNSSIRTGYNSDDMIYLLRYGSVVNTKTGHYLLPGEWLNMSRVLSPGKGQTSSEWTVSHNSQIIMIPGPLVRSIPSLNWALREIMAKM